MSDDLAKRLRETTHMYQVDCELKMKCADRIEELEAACWRIKEDRDMVIGLLDSDKDRADAAEAKLAKALLIIEAYGDDEGYIPKRVVHLWNELKGEDNE